MITIYPQQHGYNKGFVVMGHADYAEHGQDIVCAGVSAIAQATLKGLEEHGEVDAVVETGFMDVEITDNNLATRIIMDVFELGIEDIAKQYPNFVVFRPDGSPF